MSVDNIKEHTPVGDSEGSGDEEDAEGVWSPDIEQSFQEALAIYPPCGRRKIILSEEGKMYGRNELIARYIKLRTGKTRSRKQVSSHIQVLARKKSRDLQSKIKEPGIRERAMHALSTMSSAQIVSAQFGGNQSYQAVMPPNMSNPPSHLWHAGAQAPRDSMAQFAAMSIHGAQSSMAWENRCISSSKLKMTEFSAYVELGGPSNASDMNIAAVKQEFAQSANNAGHKHTFININGCGIGHVAEPSFENIDAKQVYDKFPEKKGGLKDLFEKGPESAFFLVKCWADVNFTDCQENDTPLYAVNTEFESMENMTISCSTKVCSFGKQVVEKVETEYARFDSGRFIYRIHRSPMCEYMINFITKLKQLPDKQLMNSVLENFTILQVVTNRDTSETLLCVAYVFEVLNSNDDGSQYHIYRLVKES